MESLLVAVSVQKEGDRWVITDDHFGEGEKFLIYRWDLSKNSLELIEERENTAGEERFHGDPQKAQKISGILPDVQVLVGRAMGPNIKRMRKRYLPVISRIADVEETLEKLVGFRDEVLKEVGKGEGEDRKVIYIK